MPPTKDRGSIAAPTADPRCEPPHNQGEPDEGRRAAHEAATSPDRETSPEPEAPPAASGDDDFAALFAASEAQQPAQARVQPGDVVRGRVVAIGPATAFVAIGAKAEAVI